MRIAVFDTHPYDHQAFEAANHAFGLELAFLTPRPRLLPLPLPPIPPRLPPP